MNEDTPYYEKYFSHLGLILEYLPYLMKNEVIKHILYLSQNSNNSSADILRGETGGIPPQMLKDAEININATLGDSPLKGYRSLFSSIAFTSIIESYVSLLQPKVPELPLNRFGNTNDGGYILIDDFPKNSIIYSIGIFNDASFDLAMAEMGFPVNMFDHTIDALPCEHRLFTFTRRGLAPKDSPPDFLSLESILATADKSDDLILKMDIEGDEWPVLAASPESLLYRFRQIVIEMHGFTSFSSHEEVQRKIKALERLNCHHQVVHVHANNNAPYEIIGGLPFPDVLEVTYARKKDFGEFKIFDGKYPRPELDRPNVIFKADYALPFWSSPSDHY